MLLVLAGLTLTACSQQKVSVKNRQFYTEYSTTGEYPAMWEEVVQSLPQLKDETIYLERFFGSSYSFDSEGYLKGMSFEIFVPLNEENRDIYSVTLNKSSYSVSYLKTDGPNPTDLEIEALHVCQKIAENSDTIIEH